MAKIYREGITTNRLRKQDKKYQRKHKMVVDNPSEIDRALRIKKELKDGSEPRS